MQAYKDFSDKWASVLDQNMTDAEIAVLGKPFTSYSSCIPMSSSLFLPHLIFDLFHFI